MPKNAKPTSPWCCLGGFSSNNKNNNKFDLKTNILKEDALTPNLDLQAVSNTGTGGKVSLQKTSGRRSLQNPTTTISNEEFEVVADSKNVPTDSNAPQNEYKDEYKELGLPNEEKIEIPGVVFHAGVESEEEEETKEDLENSVSRDTDTDTDTDTDYLDAEGEDEAIKELEKRLKALVNKEVDSEKESDIREAEVTENSKEVIERPKLVNSNSNKGFIEDVTSPISSSHSKRESESESECELKDKKPTPVKSSSAPSLGELDKQANDTDTDFRKTSLSDTDANKSDSSDRSDTPRPVMLLSSAIKDIKLGNKVEVEKVEVEVEVEVEAVGGENSGILSETEHSVTI